MIKANLYKHYLSKHPESCVCECDICVTQPTESRRGVECQTCGQKFCRKMILYAHKKVAHDFDRNSRYRCKYCSKLFTTNKARFMHIHKHHGKGSRHQAAATSLDMTQSVTSGENVEGEEKENSSSTHVIHIGEGQGVQYLPRLSEASLSAVIKELMIVSSDKLSKLPYKCLLCGRSFAKTKYIRLHIRRNHVKDEDQPYRCKICGSGFVRLTEFRKHSRAHSGFRPYKCKVCAKAFKQQANLTDHMNIHKGVKEYQCFICNRQFCQRGALNAHINHHDKLKPFKCTYCDKGFTTRGELSRHMQKYNTDEEMSNSNIGRSFLCHICQDSFTHFPLLQKHIEERHPEKPFQCQVCSYRFAAFTSLYNHKLKTEHFLETELEDSENSSVRRVRRNRKTIRDTQEVIYTIQEGDIETIQRIDPGSLQHRFDVDSTSKRHNVALSSGQQQTDTVCFVGDQGDVAETVYITTPHGEYLEGQGDGSKRLEVVIEQFHPEEVVSGSQISNENEELLSIAKKLTELSTYTEAEVNEAENATMLQEEDEIMKDMLDADQDLLDNLGKQLGARRDDGVESWHTDTSTVQVYPQVTSGETTHVEIAEGVDLGVNIGRHEVENSGMEAEVEVGAKQTVIEASPTKPIPTNMEELATLIAENSQMTLGEESVTAYQTDDGSIIYVCMDQPNETYDVSTSNEYTEMETRDNLVNVKQSYDNDQGTGETLVMEEQIVQEAGTVIQEDGSVIEETGTIIQADGTVIQDNETIADETGTVIQVGSAVIQEDGTVIQEPSTVLHEAGTIIAAVEDEDTADNVETVEAAAAAAATETLIPHVADEARIGSSNIGQAGISEMTQVEETGMNNEEYGEGGQKVLEYIHDEQTFIKEELINADYGKMVDEEMSKVISEERVLRYELNDNEFRCLKCNYTCVNHKNMKKHLKRHTPFGHRQFDCTMCDKKFITNAELVRHVHTHTGEKNFECRYCAKRFRQAGHLKDHIKTHLGQKDFHCSECDATFRTKNQCASHWQRKHTDERVYCNECGKSFSDKQGLIKHKGSIHSGMFSKFSKPRASPQPGDFQCHICGASYQKKASLSSHIQTHKTDKKPTSYICEICGCGCRSLPTLNEHILLAHSEETPEICEYCGSKFKLKKQLQWHIKSRHKQPDQKPRKIYICECGKKFSTKNSLAYHIGKNDVCRGSKVTMFEDKETEANEAVTSITGANTVV